MFFPFLLLLFCLYGTRIGNVRAVLLEWCSLIAAFLSWLFNLGVYNLPLRKHHRRVGEEWRYDHVHVNYILHYRIASPNHSFITRQSTYTLKKVSTWIKRQNWTHSLTHSQKKAHVLKSYCVDSSSKLSNTTHRPVNMAVLVSFRFFCVCTENYTTGMNVQFIQICRQKHWYILYVYRTLLINTTPLFIV